MTTAPKKKILVIDDDRGPRESLRILLKNEFEVFCADGVKPGLELLRTQEMDLVISDIRMPEIDGIEGLRQIRELDALVPVIMLTGFGALDTAREALRYGANDYLKKPFDIQELLQQVREHLAQGELRRRRARSEAELQELNQRLQDDLARRDHLVSLGQASAELVHDLRNPMTVVYGYLQLLTKQLSEGRNPQDTESAPVTLEYVKIIEQSVKRCTNLIDVWQRLGRKHPDQVGPFALSELLPETVREKSDLAATRRAVIEVRQPSGDAAAGRVLGDRTQLSRVFHNLIDNAIDAVPDDGSGRIVLTCETAGDELAVSVSDNGSGIAPEIRDRILEAYYSTKPPGRGTGLGLFITKKIIDDHHGRMTLESVVGQGTRFTVFLPAWDMLSSAVAPSNPEQPSH